MPEHEIVIETDETFWKLSKSQFAMCMAIVSVLCTVMVGIAFGLALHQQKSALAGQAKVNRAQHAALAADRHALAVQCQTDALTVEALKNTVKLLKNEIRTGAVPPQLVDVDRKALDRYEDLQLQFAQRSACPEVKP